MANIKRLKKLLDDRPDIIYRSNNDLNGYVFYECIEGKVQCFNTHDKPLKMFNELKRKATIILKEEEKELNLLKKSFSVIE